MFLPSFLRRRTAAPRHDGAGAPVGDAGVTLIEVAVTTGVMAVAMAVFGSGIVQMYDAANKNESMAIAQTQLHNAFLRLDRDIRYASGISRPDRTGSDNWYVEYVIANTGVPKCTQLRLLAARGLLQSRTGRQGGPVGGWTTLASYLSTPRQFTRTDASSAGAPHQQLTVTLTLQAGSGRTVTRREAAYSFTALNTTADTVSDDVCSAMGRP
jgi:type II secretory pathway pseudopilin PulG